MRNLLVLLGFAFFSAASGQTIGVDNRHGFNEDALLGSGADFDAYRAVIEALGFTLVPLDSFLAGDIEGLDAVIINQNYQTNLLSADEIVALREFQLAGGGLLVQVDGGTDFVAPVMNLLVQPYGVSFSRAVTEGAGRVIEGFVVHPVTVGVQTVGIDAHRRLEMSIPPALDLTIGDGEDDMLAAVLGERFGAGNLVMISDSSIWSDPDSGSDFSIDFGDSLRLFVNSLLFVTRDGPPTEQVIRRASAAVDAVAVRAATRVGAPGGSHGD
ncbi:MAG: hypothetical protein AAF184_19370 [Pseudomonadota bacterium]